MKKITVLILFLLLSVATFAQIKPFKLGFRVAPSVTWLSPNNSNIESNGASFGFAWGLNGEVTLTKNYFVLLGAEYSYFNGSLNYDGLLINDDGTLAMGNLDRKYHLQYIDIPIAIKLRTNDFNNYRFFGQLGFITSFNIRARADDEFFNESDGALNPNLSQDKKNINSEITLMRESLLVGAGVEYEIDHSLSLIFGVNYKSGISNILKGEDQIGKDLSAFGSLIELSISVVF